MEFDFKKIMNYRNGFILIALVVGWTMMFLSKDYGPLEDTKIHQDHGVRILNYFKGIDEIASLSPIDEEGNYIDVAVSQENENRGMNGFGGFFDLLTNFLHQYFSSFEVYQFKNLINSIFGFLLFLFCGLLGKELGGWKTGLFTLVFVVLCPVIFGYSMNNPKDIPAAAFYMFSLFHIIKLLKELPRVTLKRAFFLILNISLLINIRVIGLMTLGYLLLAVFSWWLLQNYKSRFKQVVIKDTLLLAAKTIGVCILSYLAVAVFWPYAQTNPLKVPIEILIKMGEFRGFENLQLFEGVWQSSFNAPWYYAIKNLFIIMMPLHAFLGFFLIPLVYYKNTKINMLYVSMVIFASVFPMILIVIGKPNNHSGSRQFMFSILPIVVVSALSWIKLFEMIPKKNIAKLLFGVLILVMLQPLHFMVRYHPMQALYFSPIVGGVSGAYGNYEIDYYGVGVRPAIDWLEEHVGDADNPPKVRLYYGSQTKATFYLNKTPKLQHVLTRRDSPDWDYSIIMLAEGKYKRDHVNVNWSPENTVHEVKVDGVSVCFIVKNNYQVKNHISTLETQMKIRPTVNGYIQLSLLYYNKSDYFNCIQTSKKAIQLDPNNSIVYNNLCSSYNRLKMFDKAKEACEKSLAINNTSELTKNNLSVSINGINSWKNKKLSITEYVNLSFYYYKLGFYKRCIETSEDLLLLDPNNAAAYNNICSSYNVLGEFDKAIKACEKALEINPDFQLAKNNLKWIETKRKEIKE
ncbi:tetratricopeptide repeat protein [Aquimarina sp. 2201CG14-23]|uniref:tetratricopeptide repeat protein n=1 Tax=Aquimarina mycalae TaxID=3040073 RepID=UPI002477E6C5|nr:tetratricopeptide repeat protein [Aquimarina sp. 2201CG14-23]MDH7445049.1 tetratricopeptide repeat protein [Aquimarina sp. 2201CG14-23]